MTEYEGSEGMPEPPDLTALFEQQKEQLAKAQKDAQDAFKVFADRGAAIGKLTDAYQQELITVFTIAKAVTTPPTAIAAIPPVLAAANKAFAMAPLTEQQVISMIDAKFAPLKPE